MAHIVTCQYCKAKFDRDKVEYVVVGTRRYAHATCAIKDAEENSTPIPEVVNPLDNVVCQYCKKPMNRKDADCVSLGNGKYAHKECDEKHEPTDQEKLERYIMQLFKTDHVNQRIRKQINDFMAAYNYTYSGIHKALVYFYEVKGNSLEKANGGIGIVPYIYNDAYNYYYSIWLAKQKNESKNIVDYLPQETVIHIPSPQRKVKKRKLFTFLDEEEPMASKYVDVTAIMQVVGCVYNNPQLLEFTDKYTITDEDFPDEFHKTVFGAIYKIHELGADSVTLQSLEDFLSTRPKSAALFKQNKGEEWLMKVADTCLASAFDYYYGRLKKMTLLRAYDNCGVDVTDIYDPDNILDSKKKQLQEDLLDNATLEQIADKIDEKISAIRLQYVDDAYGEAVQAGDGILDLIERFKEHPEVGVPMYGPLINTVTRGARLKKFYLRSAATGVGKTRSMIADACYIACNKIYDETFGWISTGASQPTLFITTEQELEEIQTMMLAFLSNVNEEHILNGKYEGDEEDRVKEAAKILAAAPLYVEELPDFSLKDVEDKIKKNIRDHDVKYVFHDYIHTSLKILEEITRRSGGVKLREDNILFMLSTKLKDICNQYGIFIMSATQLNGDYQESKTPDQNLLRGAKAIADKIDYGSILLGVKEEDLEALETILASNVFDKPTIKMSIYKNRRGRYKGVILWCKADLGCCRIQPMFCTTYDYDIVSIDNIKIMVEEESAF